MTLLPLKAKLLKQRRTLKLMPKAVKMKRRAEMEKNRKLRPKFRMFRLSFVSAFQSKFLTLI